METLLQQSQTFRLIWKEIVERYLVRKKVERFILFPQKSWCHSFLHISCMIMCNTVGYWLGLTLSCHLAFDLAILPCWHVRSYFGPPTNLLPHYDHMASVVLFEFLTFLLLLHVPEQRMAVLYFATSKCVCVCVFLNFPCRLICRWQN
jgi:hypothetical protein